MKIPVIVAGDFNSFPSSIVYHFYNKGNITESLCSNEQLKEVSLALEDKYPTVGLILG